MIKQFFILGFVLIFGFIAWGVYQKTQWTLDYTQFQVATVQVQPLDKTFEKHIVPKYFEKAKVITNDTHLRYPEDIAVSNDGTIYTGLADGTLVAIDTEGTISTLYKFNTTNGIYGIVITSDDTTLYFVTELEGIVKFDITTKTPTFLLKGINGQNFAALNNLCLDQQNQIIYATDSTPISTRFANKQILLKHKKGRIISFNLHTNEASVVLTDLAFPNGIVYEKSTHSIIFSELNAHKILRYYVDGENKGTLQTLVSNLFGFGDNLKLNDKGQLLVGIPATRDELLDYVSSHPQLRRLLLYAPERLISALAKKRAGGIRIDTKTGQITEYIFGGPVKTNCVTTILEKNNKIYFSSLKNPTILVLDRNANLQGQSQGVESKQL